MRNCLENLLLNCQRKKKVNKKLNICWTQMPSQLSTRHKSATKAHYSKGGLEKQDVQVQMGKSKAICLHYYGGHKQDRLFRQSMSSEYL